MTLVALAASVLAFIAVLRLCRVQQIATDVIGVTREALGVMSNADLSERQKESRIRAASIRLFRGFLLVSAGALAALVAAGLVVWAGAALGVYTLDAALATAMGWPFLLGSTVAALAVWVVLERRQGRAQDRAAPERAEIPYGGLDKALHEFAFASPERQRRMGELESSLFRSRIDMDRAARPVFVTSLPRAGTTILLEVLAELPEFASATYRHMPFTLAPLLWERVSRAFRKAGEPGERAHGDGIVTGVDSPEAFEEMIWMAFWPEHYGRHAIRPWSARDRDPEFEAFFRTHLAKIVATRPGAQRYLSKNNANIARLPLLEALCPDATILIPVRNPRAQVASLLRQHLRFAELHAREPFARRYMEGLGHFEFGGALRPIDFGGTPPELAAADRAGFWVRYWSQAYEAVLSNAGPRTVFVDYDALCKAPERHLPALAETLGLAAPSALTGMAHRLRPSSTWPDPEGTPAALLSRADEIHAALLARCVVADRRMSKAS